MITNKLVILFVLSSCLVLPSSTDLASRLQTLANDGLGVQLFQVRPLLLCNILPLYIQEYILLFE